jgi:CheY-like chemotaxis protein/anti-sigma regulatory factor (Ser/Thr protein kinase)
VVEGGAVGARAPPTARPAAAAKGLALDASLSGDVLTVADGERLQQVVWNLLSNAVKFTPRGGRVTVTARRQASQLSIEVRDTGVGILPEFLPHVFERFTQADSSTTRRFGGLGLGLAIVRHIVELHGGTVGVESAGEGTGSVFTITLPVRAAIEARAPAAAASGVAAAHAPEASSLSGARVLVVDDEHDARDVLHAILTGAGAAVSVAASAREALELMTSIVPDVLISDVGMAVEDGYTFIRQVRALGGRAARVPAVALTAYGHPADRAHALAAGFDRHVPKPIMPNELIAVVASVIGRDPPNGPE